MIGSRVLRKKERQTDSSFSSAGYILDSMFNATLSHFLEGTGSFIWNSDNFFLIPESQRGLCMFRLASVQLILAGTRRPCESKAWLFFSSSKFCISSIITSDLFSFFPHDTCKIGLDLTSDFIYSFLISISLNFSSALWDIPLENHFVLSTDHYCLQFSYYIFKLMNLRFF